MSKVSIFDNIAKQSAIEVQKILASANEDAKKTALNILEDAKLNSEKLVEEAIKDCNMSVEQKSNEYKLIEKQYINKVQSEILESLAIESLKKLEELKDEKLCDFVAKLILQENVKGNETIKVSKKDYSLFQKALCSNKNNECDLLNKKLKDIKYQFNLSDDFMNIESGFVLIGENFDLSFEFKSLIEKVMEVTEKEISEYLFD